MRLFVAIEIPKDIKDKIQRITEKLKSIEGVKVSSPFAMHLTLLFLGDDKNKKDTISKLKSVSFKKFKVTIEGTGFFPSEKKINVAWLGIRKTEQLVHLQGEIARLFLDEKKYKPHLTIARIRKLIPKDKKKLIEIMGLFREPMEFTADKFKLFSSELTPLGPIHEAIETYPATNL